MNQQQDLNLHFDSLHKHDQNNIYKNKMIYDKFFIFIDDMSKPPIVICVLKKKRQTGKINELERKKNTKIII